MLAIRLALRDLRGGFAGLRIVFACLALGVAAIAAVGTLRAGIERTLASDGRRLLGGDIEVLGGSQPLPDTLRGFLHARGARTSDVVTMRSMLVAPSGERVLVELKAVDAAWPLLGTPTLRPAQNLAGALHGGMLVDPLVLPRLHATLGDAMRLGDARLTLRGTLTNEPDRVADPSIFGPRVLVGLVDLPATGLLQPGSIVEYRLRALLPAGTDVAHTIADVRNTFPGIGWRIRDAEQAAPGVDRFVDQTSLFLTLVGLTSLLVGGIGVAGGVKTWLQARTRSIATLRCLGASPALVFWICLIQVGVLCAAGVLAGLIAGAALPAVAISTLGDLLPIAPAIGVFWRPLALAAAYGGLVALAFSLPPLGRAMRIPGAALFRDAEQPASARPSAALLAGSALLGIALVALIVATSPDPRFALGFCAAAAAALGLFAAAGFLLPALTRAMPVPKNFWARFGLSGLHRPGAATPTLLVSVGLGLSTLAAVAVIQGNIAHEIVGQMPQDAPSFFFIDIQPDQVDRFREITATTAGVQDTQLVPSLRARLVSVAGTPAEQVHATPQTAWALRGDRGLTYAAAMPAGTHLVAGRWWPADYAGPPLVSFDANLARGWGVKLGDILRVNVLGRDLDLRVANLRDIAWRSLGLNFAMVASPRPLEQAPHTAIATVRADPASQPALLQKITDALPNVSGIRVADVLDAIAALLGKLAVALAASGSLTLVSGALVLAGAVAGTQQRRIREAVILKTLGATRSQIRAAWLVEFGVLGLVAGVLAALVGTAASFAVMHFVLDAPWWVLPGRLLGTVAGCVALMLALGYAGMEAALRAKPAPLLRRE
jgi:putative ABC transport system permease protein